MRVLSSSRTIFDSTAHSKSRHTHKFKRLKCICAKATKYAIAATSTFNYDFIKLYLEISSCWSCHFTEEYNLCK